LADATMQRREMKNRIMKKEKMLNKDERKMKISR
jgi:hypothetical protein